MSGCPMTSLAGDWEDVERILAQPARSTKIMNTATRKVFKSLAVVWFQQYKSIVRQRIATL
jgi:hypothetical protein